jgi:hypothetical protein
MRLEALEIFPFNLRSSLVTVLQIIHQLTLDYFRAYPADAMTWSKVQSHIPKDLCFDDGSDIYCGEALLNGTIFLLDSPQWKTLHDWITAILNGMALSEKEKVDSAVFQDFVRYFVFGLFQLNERSSSPPMNSATCKQALEQLEELGEKPNEWAINPCKLILNHKNHKTKSSQKNRRL